MRRTLAVTVLALVALLQVIQVIPAGASPADAPTGPAPYCHDGACHPADGQGYVTDGTVQRDDLHCVGDSHQIGACLAARRGVSFGCLSVIVDHEDPAWDPRVINHRSGATGLPQALPGYKMAAAGVDWRTSARTQLIWLLDHYAPQRYGGICPAAAHEQRYGTY